MGEIDELKARREKVLSELRELQDWLAGRSPDNPVTLDATRHKYLRHRPGKVRRVLKLEAQSAELRERIKALNVAEHDAPGTSEAMDFYHAVAELEERGVDVGDKLRDLMREIER